MEDSSSLELSTKYRLPQVFEVSVVINSGPRLVLFVPKAALRVTCVEGSGSEGVKGHYSCVRSRANIGCSESEGMDWHAWDSPC